MEKNNYPGDPAPKTPDRILEDIVITPRQDPNSVLPRHGYLITEDKAEDEYQPESEADRHDTPKLFSLRSIFSFRKK